MVEPASNRLPASFLNRSLLITFLIGLFFSLISISLTQIFLGLNVILWLILLFRHEIAFRVPGFFWPLMAYVFFSLVASAFSVNPIVSFRDCRELLLYLLIPAAMATLSSPHRLEMANLILIASGFVNIGYSLLMYLSRSQAEPRLKGFMGHYMTEAGLLMLYILLGVAQTIFGKGKKRWLWAVLSGGSCCLLLFTLTRSAWFGLAAGIILLVSLWRPVYLVALPFLLAAVLVLSPFQVKRRIMDSFNLASPSNRIRIEFIRAGWHIIGDYPLFGCGPDTVDMVFQHPKYGLSAEAKLNVHLHNNMLQIAAERGLFSLLAWLIFMAWSFWLLLKKWKGKPTGALPWIAAALASVLALFMAGLFEYNFADSEVIMFYLLVLAIPFASVWEEKGKRK